MTEYLANIMAALRRVQRLQPPDERDQRILIPLLEGRLAEYEHDPIRFMRVRNHFVVDTTEFRCYRGLGYLVQLLARPGRSIPCKDLSPVHEPVLSQEIYDKNAYYDFKRRKEFLNDLLRDSEWLKEADIEEAKEVTDELRMIEKTISDFWFNARSKPFNNAVNNNRLAVRAAIERAIRKLKEQPETEHIGEHLHDNIQYGFSCRYRGKWRWKL